jgi:hypothetical protein
MNLKSKVYYKMRNFVMHTSHKLLLDGSRLNGLAICKEKNTLVSKLPGKQPLGKLSR